VRKQKPYMSIKDRSKTLVSGVSSRKLPERVSEPGNSSNVSPSSTDQTERRRKVVVRHSQLICITISKYAVLRRLTMMNQISIWEIFALQCQHFDPCRGARYQVPGALLGFVTDCGMSWRRLMIDLELFKSGLVKPRGTVRWTTTSVWKFRLICLTRYWIRLNR
jgi:hypothetical protein